MNGINSNRAAWRALFSTGFLALALWWCFRDTAGSFWASMEMSKAGLTAEYCEANRFEAFIRQPINAWSNLVYCFWGIWAIDLGLQDLRRRKAADVVYVLNPLQAFPAMTIWLGLMLVGLCWGSFFFHASVTRLGQHWDMGFTYAVAIALVAMGGYRWALLRGAQARPALRWGWLAFAIGGAVCMTVFKWWISGVIALPLLMLAGLGLAVAVYLRRRSHMQGRLLLAGVIALVLAAIFRSLDLAKVGCNPDGWLQFHACWHLCTGTAAFLFWRTLWGERVGAMPD